jgi:putative SOS response-associated peptidase YedK
MREFVIITKDAYGVVAAIHDRMPVILRANQIEAWLNGALTPEEITRLDFNAAVAPCGEVIKDDFAQLSL